MRDIVEEEVVSTILGLELDKVSGPDAFSIHFYRFCWSIIKHDLC
jgi:hypothetical protein